MKFERANNVVFKHDIEYKRNKNWEHWVLLSSDHHWDSKKCDRDLMDYHLKQAQDRNADVTADNTNNSLKITVTGITGKNIRWVCSMKYTEVAI